MSDTSGTDTGGQGEGVQPDVTTPREDENPGQTVEETVTERPGETVRETTVTEQPEPDQS